MNAQKEKMMIAEIVSKTIHINAPVLAVWNALTNHDIIKLWISEGEINVISDWKVGSSIVFSGSWHGIELKDKGTICKFEPGKVLQYNYWSKLSRLPDAPENYSVISFELSSKENQTIVTLTQTNFVTETMYKHSNFYWGVALEMLRKVVLDGI